MKNLQNYKDSLKEITKAERCDKLNRNTEQQRRLLQITTGESTDNHSDKDVRKFIKQLKTSLKITVGEIKVNQEIARILKQLKENNKIQIHLFGDTIRKEDTVDFIKPLFIKAINDLNYILNFLIDTSILKINIHDRLSYKQRVYYTGVIINSNNESLSFKRVDNNFAVLV